MQLNSAKIYIYVFLKQLEASNSRISNISNIKFLRAFGYSFGVLRLSGAGWRGRGWREDGNGTGMSLVSHSLATAQPQPL
jgi:hypothetical protein